MTDADCPISKLLAIGDIVSQVDPALGAWLTDAVLDYVDMGLSLDVGLRLAPGRDGQESARFRYLRRRRNFHLRAALDELRSIAALRREILAFYRVAACVRDAPAAPADWPLWRCEIWRAARYGVDLPRTEHGLRKALIEHNSTPPVQLLEAA